MVKSSVERKTPVTDPMSINSRHISAQNSQQNPPTKRSQSINEVIIEQYPKGPESVTFFGKVGERYKPKASDVKSKKKDRSSHADLLKGNQKENGSQQTEILNTEGNVEKRG